MNVDLTLEITQQNVELTIEPNLITINVITSSGVGIPEAPIDGQLYGRKDADWEIIPDGGAVSADNVTETATRVFVTPAEKTEITHSNRSILNAITEAFTTGLKNAYDGAVSWIATNGTNLISHLSNTSNPHNTTASQVGLGNVQNVDTTTTENVSDSSNKRYVTDAQLVVIGNTSGTNTGDNSPNTNANAYADAKVADSITNGVTAIAPSQNAVFDEFALYSKKQIVVLSADLTNSTVTDTDITGFLITIPAGKSVDFNVLLPFSSAAVSTGIGIGVKCVTGVGANGNLLGNISTDTRLSATTVSIITNIVDQVANATVSYDSLTGVSTAGLTNICKIFGTLTNLATNTDATAQIVFRSEVASSTVTIEKGSTLSVDTI
jgi:hypothetical protein